MEFSLIIVYYLYTSCVYFYLKTPIHLLLVVPSCASTNFLIKRKEKKKKINNDLAIFGRVMTCSNIYSIEYTPRSLILNSKDSPGGEL